jgi:phosphatidylserine/phosphatidylglycerophosphate/cardiolipin synthase-like enzyme
VVELSSTRDVLAGLARANEIEAHAYTLHGDTLHALEDAARRGAHVVVELEGNPYNNPHLARENQRVVNELRSAGVDARLGDPVHAKTIVADGTLYLDDKNFGPHDLVLCADDATDVRSIATVKHEALAAEAQLLRGASAADDIIVESESFGCCNAVFSALARAAGMGASPRLLVCKREASGNARERGLLQQLTRDGVRVRICDDSEKLAAAGDGAWIGSANATVAFDRADLPDWGLRTNDPSIVHAVRARVEAVWSSARDFKSQKA